MIKPLVTTSLTSCSPHCDGACDGSDHIKTGRVATAVSYCEVSGPCAYQWCNNEWCANVFF